VCSVKHVTPFKAKQGCSGFDIQNKFSTRQRRTDYLSQLSRVL